MATNVMWERHPTTIAWSASGSISEELAPKPYTITRMAILVRGSITTTTATFYCDPWDRIISRLNITGNGRTFLDISQMPLLYHFSRYQGCGPRRPQIPLNSLTAGENYFLYMLHFGSRPTRVNPKTGVLEDNPFDLTGGIPPAGSGNLTLGGSFAANSVMGGNATIADADLEIYLCGVRPDDGDPAEAFQPQFLPEWSMQSPTLSATSSAFATEHSIPAGHFLRSALVMLTNGTNNPRDDMVLNSLEVYSQKDGKTLWKYGGQAGVENDYQAAEMLSQFHPGRITPFNDDVSTFFTGYPTASGGVPGTITAAGIGKDAGLVWLPFWMLRRPHPTDEFGLDLRYAASGDLKLRYGIADATGVAMHIFYQRFVPNPAHPGTLALLAA